MVVVVVVVCVCVCVCGGGGDFGQFVLRGNAQPVRVHTKQLSR